MVNVRNVKSGDCLIFNVNQKKVSMEVIGVDPIMTDIYSFDLQAEDKILNIIVNYKGEDILGECVLGDVYKVEKHSKTMRSVNYELADELKNKK